MSLSNSSTPLGALRGCSSWDDIQQKMQPLSEKQKGDIFEHLVKAYLQLEPEYASTLKHVWLHREVPLEVLKKLRLPATDQGIDIVAETKDGEFWGIQCKYRQETDQSLTWREVSTFAGLMGMCRGITFGLICSTTERFTHVLKNQEKIGFCALDVWQELDAEFFTRLWAHLANKPEVLKPLRPRPHQKLAVKDGVTHFVKGRGTRGKLIMPCGSGKSLTAYWLAGALKARRIVIAVPSLALIRQTLKVWLREALASHQAVRWICVCSDESAGRVERDDVSVLRQDIAAPCRTDPDEIAAWLKQKHHGITVVFTTYQSGEALATAARSAKFRFDLGIMDEAHKTVGATDKLFSHLLHDANLPIARRIFMTATERRYKGQGDEVLSMDAADIYGETFHLLSFKRALEYDPPILSDYKIVTIFVSREEVAELIRKNVFVKPDKGRWDKEIEADMLASLIALRKAMKKYPIRHAVSFHSSIQRSEWFKAHNDAFTRASPAHGELETFHVSGRTPTGTRARIIKEFARTKRGLITNARCLTEGVDVPGIDCVLFADPRRSAVDIVQAVGRALRPAEGKKFGYVIVPVLKDADATHADVFESEEFKEILATLRALAANDDRIIEYFRAVSEGRQRTGGGSVEFDLDERLTRHIDLAQFIRDIELKCWDRLTGLRRSRLTIERILKWADAHHQKFAQWPTRTSGDVHGAPSEKWANINTALSHGVRSLAGDSSLAQLLAEKRGVRNVAALPPLSVMQIMQWADLHHEKTRHWPKFGSGEVFGAPGEKCAHLSASLSQGQRGLPGGSSLAQLLAEQRGVRNIQALANLDVKQILAWADEHHRKTGQWPNVISGDVLGAAGEKWAHINASLRVGQRGLPGGSSLAQLLSEKRGLRNTGALATFTLEQILQWADQHHKLTGLWPTRNSGGVHGAPGEKWSNINSAFIAGLRGLPGGSSLAQLLLEKRGVQHHLAKPNLTVKKILQWADLHHKRTGEWPNAKSGDVPGAPGEKWRNIHQALYKGLRGLSDGSSLAQLLWEKRGVQHIFNRPDLTEKQILEWVDLYHEKTGKWPGQKSGAVRGAPGEKWAHINASLRVGQRGLPGGSSLALLLAKKRNIRNRTNLPALSKKLILEWADLHYKKFGEWPKLNIGNVLGSPGDKWVTIDTALRNGLRGLPGDSSLARLLSEKRGVRNVAVAAPLTLKQVLQWADAHHKKTGDWPKRSSGVVHGAPGEKWANVSAALSGGGRGLPGDSSLSQLLSEKRGYQRRKGARE